MAGQWNDLTELLRRLDGGQFLADPGAALMALTEGVDDAIGFETPNGRLLFVVEPALVGELLVGRASLTTKGPGLRRAGLLGNGLLTSEGEDHARARRLVGPAFARSRLEGYGNTMGRRAAAHSAAWEDGSRIDMHRAMGELTLDVVGRTLFGLDLASESESIRTAVTESLNAFGQQTVGPLATDDEPPLQGSAIQTLHQVIDRIIASHRAENSKSDDVISALLSAVDDADHTGITDQEVHDNVMTLLLAGHETTANALSWTWLLLHQHPDVAARLHEEVDALAGAPLTVAHLAALRYTRAVITEAMRLYPPAWIIARRASVSFGLGRWEVPEGTLVTASPWVLHRDPRWFADPERCDPSRWLDGRGSHVPRFAYLPFGAGPRSCIGEQFAWMEATLLLATIASDWQPELAPGAVVEREYRVTLRPGGGMPMVLRRRDAANA